MSKNRFSFQNDYVPIEDADYEDALAFALGSVPPNNLQEVILDFAEANRDLLYQLVARLVPMSMDDTIELLQDAAKYYQQDNELLNPDVQAKLTFVAGVLLEKAEAQIRADELLGASCICFAVLRALEPLLTRVTDDGELVQRMIKDAFTVLRKLTSHDGEKETYSFILLLADAQFNERQENDRHYDEDWKKLAGALRNHIAAMGKRKEID